jgi:hypothetical protein
MSEQSALQALNQELEELCARLGDLAGGHGDPGSDGQSGATFDEAMLQLMTDFRAYNERWAGFVEGHTPPPVRRRGN